MHAGYPYQGPLLPIIRIVKRLAKGYFHGWGQYSIKLSPLSKLNPTRILVIESHLIGDQVLMLPMLEALSMAYPNAELHILGNPWLQELVIPLPEKWVFHPCWIPWAVNNHTLRKWWTLLSTLHKLRQYNFDLAIDVRGDIRNQFLLALSGGARRVGYDSISPGEGFLTDLLTPPTERMHYTEGHRGVLRALGIPDNPYLPKLIPTNANLVSACLMLQQGPNVPPKRIVGIHPGASQADRRLSVSQICDLVIGLRSLGWEPLLVGGEKEMPLLGSVHNTLETPPKIIKPTLGEFIALCQVIQRLIAMDSGPAHIAAAASCQLTVIIHQDKVIPAAPIAKVGLMQVVAYSGSIINLEMSRILDTLKGSLKNQL